MADTIFLITDDGDFKEMTGERYDSEDLLQRLLADHPSVLSGVHTDDLASGEWLLVAREAGVPDEEGAGGRWSLDHLFLDRDGIPTLVEVKRSSDTRIRREVVGQMLDYAANSVAYWPIESIQSFFEATVKASGTDNDPDSVLENFLGADRSADEFWQAVKTNLQAGKIRMVFVADEIPRELQRIIEFLNEQMDPAEVLGIEVKQFVGAGVRSLVPKLIGRTALSDSRKIVGGGGSRRKWDEESFFAQTLERHGQKHHDAVRRLYDWCVSKGTRIWWGEGKLHGSFIAVLDLAIGTQYLFGVRGFESSQWVEIAFGRLLGPFASEGMRHELRARLNKIPGVSIPEDAIDKYPSIPISDLISGEASAALFDSYDWFLEQHDSAGTEE